jgi:hypothetical protein
MRASLDDDHPAQLGERTDQLPARGWLPWAALLVGTAASLAANVATAQPGPVSRIIAGWPALAPALAA